MDKKSVDQWHRGQAAASKKIEEDRTGFIVELTPKRSLRIYLSLKPDPRRSRTPQEPSFVLKEMRKILSRRTKEADRSP